MTDTERAARLREQIADLHQRYVRHAIAATAHLDAAVDPCCGQCHDQDGCGDDCQCEHDDCPDPDHARQHAAVEATLAAAAATSAHTLALLLTHDR